MGPRPGLDRCGKSRPTEIRSPDRPACSGSLYRLSYPAQRTFYSCDYMYMDLLFLLSSSCCCISLSSCLSTSLSKFIIHAGCLPTKLLWPLLCSSLYISTLYGCSSSQASLLMPVICSYTSTCFPFYLSEPLGPNCILIFLLTPNFNMMTENRTHAIFTLMM